MRAALLVLLLFSHNVLAHNVVGWHWYNEPVKQKIPPVKKAALDFSRMSSTQKMAAFHAYYKEAQARATENPTVKNLTQVMQIRAYINRKTADYGIAFQKALLLHPELSYRRTHPVESSARQVVLSHERDEAKQAVEHFAQHYGLFYFYTGRSPLAQQLAPSIQQFSDTYHIALIGVSMDGFTLPAIKTNRRNTGQAAALGVKEFPALLLVNPETHETEPLAYGFISQNELLTRFLNIDKGYQNER